MTSPTSSLNDLQHHYETLLLKCWRDNEDGSHDIAHIRRVWRNALMIAAGEAVVVDLSVLLPATIFHDLVNLPKNDPNRHKASALSAAEALKLIADQDLSDRQRANVAHAITAHSYSAGIRAETIEAQILQDADRLDALGAVGLARVFYIAGALQTALYDHEDPRAENRPLDERRFCLDHFETKLFKLEGAMNTETGTRLAKTRTDEMRAFRERLWAEIGQPSEPD